MKLLIKAIIVKMTVAMLFTNQLTG